jgi:TolB-like protein
MDSTSIVVVPFENPGSEADLDYLRLALPDEITTLLTASRGRPIACSIGDLDVPRTARLT